LLPFVVAPKAQHINATHTHWSMWWIVSNFRGSSRPPSRFHFESFIPVSDTCIFRLSSLNLTSPFSRRFSSLLPDFLVCMCQMRFCNTWYFRPCARVQASPRPARARHSHLRCPRFCTWPIRCAVAFLEGYCIGLVGIARAGGQ
jgi:hypothetical protein